METISKAKCVKIGFVQKPHGVIGELVIKSSESVVESLESYPVLFIEIENSLVPFFISGDSIRFKSYDSVILKLDWVDNEVKAKELVGCAVYIEKSLVSTKDTELKPEFFVGFQLEDEKTGVIGEIVDVKNYSGNFLLIINFRESKLLIPFHYDLIKKIDQEQKVIILKIPDGLV